jgi:hypothetical protein
MKIKITNKPLKILSIDCEARPLSWISQDYVSKEITAIAARVIGEKKFYCKLLGEVSTEEMLEGFVKLYDEADIITGHYLRGYDLPLINSALSEFGYKPLNSKLTHDTKLDLIKSQGISKSQESLAAMFGLEHPKVKMNQNMWREANRLSDEGIKYVKERVVGDVDQQIEMRAKLMEMGMLGPPKVWKSTGFAFAPYSA